MIHVREHHIYVDFRSIFAIELKVIASYDIHSRGPIVKFLCFLLHEHVQKTVINLSVPVPVSVCLSVSQSVGQSVCQSVSLSVNQSIAQSINQLNLPL